MHYDHDHSAIGARFCHSSRKCLWKALGDLRRIGRWLNALVTAFGDRLIRYKGVLNIADADRKLFVQGVHQLASCGYGVVWPDGQPRQTRLVFIGRDLPRAVLERSLDFCKL